MRESRGNSNQLISNQELTDWNGHYWYQIYYNGKKIIVGEIFIQLDVFGSCTVDHTEAWFWPHLEGKIFREEKSVLVFDHIVFKVGSHDF